MIAAHHPRTLPCEVHHDVEHRGRIGAVADQVAEKGVLRRAPLASIGQAGLQRLQIGMHVGKQREFHVGHAFCPSIMRRPADRQFPRAPRR